MPLSLSIALAVGVGIATGVFADPALVDTVPWLVAGAGLATIVASARGSMRIARTAGLLALAAASSIVGAAAHDRALHPPLRTLLEQRVGGFAIEGTPAARSPGPIAVEGRLREDASLSAAGATLFLDVERVWVGVGPEAASGGVWLTVAGSLTSEVAGRWRSGRTVRVPALLRRPARYLNTGVPDQERALARRGIALVGTVKSAALVEVTGHGMWPDETASRARAAVRSAIARHVGARDPQSGAIATAILIGDRAALDVGLERRLQEAGTYHVIAISGGNIAIVAGLTLAVLWSIRVRGSWAAGVTMTLLAGYAFVAGGGASVVRSTVMASIYLSLRLIDQRTAPSHAIALTAAAVLLATPLSIADVGFWLTFGATGAIVLGGSLAKPPAAAWARIVGGLILASVCAEAALMPVGAMVFQRVTIAGLLLNLAAVPCMGVVQVGAMVTVVADAIRLEPLAGLSGWATHLAARGLVESASLVDWAPWATWRVAPPSWSIVLAYYAAVVLWWWTSRGLVDVRVKRLASRSALTVAAGLFVWIAIAPPTLARLHGDGRLALTVMDVGQGDAMLVTLPNGRRLMVDSGGVSTRGDFDIGDRVLGPALRARGIARLDYLAFTHGDPDHIGGAAALVRDFSPAEVWEGVPVANHEATARLREATTGKRAGWRTLQRGDRLTFGDVEVRVHHPPPPDWERQRVRNDDSLVIELRYGRVSMLLTGDIGREAETAVIPMLDLLPLVVLKSPHHGSGTSSSEEFLAAVRPDLVVISCGRGNPYGHPVPYVLERYRAVGAQILRTAQDGQVDIVTDGQSLEVKTYTGRTMQMR